MNVLNDGCQQVFRTPMKGWAVRSWDFIPSGAPVCEYIGILRRTEDVDNASENYYIFDIDCLQTMKGLDGREVLSPKLYSSLQCDMPCHCQFGVSL